MLRRVNSRHVIKALDLINAEESAILVTERPEGLPLTNFVTDRSLTINESAFIGKLIAEALAGEAERFDLFGRIPTRSFPGGDLLRWPGLRRPGNG